jgi:hypothetical protein
VPGGEVRGQLFQLFLDGTLILFGSVPRLLMFTL